MIKMRGPSSILIFPQKSGCTGFRVVVWCFFLVLTVSSWICNSNTHKNHQENHAQHTTHDDGIVLFATVSSYSSRRRRRSSSSDIRPEKANVSTTAFHPLASVLAKRLHPKHVHDDNNNNDDDDESNKKEEYSQDDVVKTLQSLSSAQIALKRLDGVAHETYQRTTSKARRGSRATDDHSSSSKVLGRATRNLGRIGCVTDALLACELCELLERTNHHHHNLTQLPSHTKDEHDDEKEHRSVWFTGNRVWDTNDTLYGRRVLFYDTFNTSGMVRSWDESC